MNQIDEFWRSVLGIKDKDIEESGISRSTLRSLMKEMSAEVKAKSVLSKKNGFKKTEIKNVYINPAKQMVSILFRPDRAIIFSTSKNKASAI